MAWISEERGLTQAEMENNANIVINTFRGLGYDDRTIAGMLGNFQHESSINPGRYEGGVGPGYGIIQWTPQSALIEHASNMGLSDWTNGDTQLKVIISEIEGTNGNNSWYTTEGFITPYYPSGATPDMIGVTGNEFLHNTMNWTPDKLAIMFMVGRERPSYDPEINHVDRRTTSAIWWYNYMGGVIPPDPPSKDTKELIVLWLSKALYGGI